MEEMKQPLEQEIAEELTDQAQEAVLPEEAPAPEAPAVPKKAKKDIGVTIGIICAAAVLCASITMSAITASKAFKNPMDLLNLQPPQIGADVDPSAAADPTTGDPSGADSNTANLVSKYAYTDEALADKYNSQIVATVGDEQLTGAMFQIFYWSSVYNYLNSNSEYVAYLGPDVTRPLGEQNYGENTTWEEYFVEAALEMYQQYVAMYKDGTAAGTVLKEEALANMENLEADFTEQAEANGID